MEDEIVNVVAFNRGTGYMGTSTSCNREDAPRYALCGILKMEELEMGIELMLVLIWAIL